MFLFLFMYKSLFFLRTLSHFHCSTHLFLWANLLPFHALKTVTLSPFNFLTVSHILYLISLLFSVVPFSNLPSYCPPPTTMAFFLCSPSSSFSLVSVAALYNLPCRSLSRQRLQPRLSHPSSRLYVHLHKRSLSISPHSISSF